MKLKMYCVANCLLEHEGTRKTRLTINGGVGKRGLVLRRVAVEVVEGHLGFEIE